MLLAVTIATLHMYMYILTSITLSLFSEVMTSQFHQVLLIKAKINLMRGVVIKYEFIMSLITFCLCICDTITLMTVSFFVVLIS